MAIAGYFILVWLSVSPLFSLIFYISWRHQKTTNKSLYFIGTVVATVGIITTILLYPHIEISQLLPSAFMGMSYLLVGLFLLISETNQAQNEHTDSKRIYQRQGSAPKSPTSTSTHQRQGEGEKLYHQSQLLENIGDAIIVTDTEFHILQWNRAAEKIYGWQETDVLGRTIRSVMNNPHVSDEAWLQAIESLKSNGIFRYEIPQVRKDGQGVFISGFVTVNRNSTGEIIGFISIERDVSEQKRMDELLRYQANILANMREAVIATDMSFAIQSWNGAAEKIYGWKAEEVLGKNVSEILQTVYENPSEREKAVAELLQNGHFINEVRQKTRLGNTLTILGSVSLVKNELGQAIGIVAVNHDITERKHVEESLRRSEEKFSKFFHSCPIPMLVSSTHHPVFMDANRAYLNLIGYEWKEIAGSNLIELGIAINDDDRDKRMQELADSRAYKTQEAQIRLRSGEVRDVLVTAERIWLGAEECDLELIVDISEQKATEKALLESEERYRSLFKQSNDAVFLISLTAEVIDVNEQAAKLLGYDIHEIKGMQTSSFLLAEEYEDSRRVLDSLLAGEKLDLYERHFRRKDGTIFLGEINIALMRDNSGKALYYQSITRDITERKAIEKALQQSEERYRSLFEQSNDAIFIIDLSAHLLAANSQAAALLGYSAEELIGMPISKTIVEGAIPESATILERILSGELISPYERLFRRKDGTVFPAMINATLVRDSLQQPLYIQSIVKNISKEKEAEQFRREQEHLLEVLLDIMGVLNSTLEFDRVIELILNNVGRIVPHDAASVMLIEEDKARIVRAISHKRLLYSELVGEEFLISATKTLSIMHETGIPLVVPDVHAYPSWIRKESMEWVRSYLGMPIIVENEVIGFLGLYSAESNFYQDTQNEGLRLFSSKIALAIKNAHLHEQAQALAAANERQRIARDLHDAVSQTLFSATIIAETLPQLFERDTASAKSGLVELSVLTRGALSEMRLLLLELRPTALLETSFTILMQNLKSALLARLEADVIFEINQDEVVLTDKHKINLYRIMQEASNNIVKYSRARHVSLKLHLLKRSIDLTIQDDGIGFDASKLVASQMGLRIMRERAAELGLELEIMSSLGQGTNIHLFGDI